MRNKSALPQPPAILSSDELRKLAKLNFVGGGLISSLTIRLLNFYKLNKFYGKYSGPGGLHFIDYTTKCLDVKYKVNQEALKNIPLRGAFVTVSNHPFGGVDGIGVFKLLLPLRPDYKTVSNYMMCRLKPLRDNFFTVDPFVTNGKASMNIGGIKASMQHLRDGHPLGLFPSGEVSSYNSDYPGICDKKWDKSIMRMVQKAEVPVIPIYFHGTNSRLFHWVGRIHPFLRTARIPSELLNKKNNTIKVTIGKPVDVDTQKKYRSIDHYIEFLREQTYALANVPDTFVEITEPDYSDRVPDGIEPIAEPLDKISLINEIIGLQKENSFLRKGTFELFCTKADHIPALMHEIGRQREITFRQVGEGSNKCLDLNRYDKTYYHLIIWDHAENKLVGAYRIGKGNELIEGFGVDALYTNSLFNYHDKFLPVLKQGIELGRSFITQDYQRKTIPLYLLWGGIFEFAKRNPWCKYLYGPVSISDTLSKLDKDRIVAYIQKHFYNNDLQKYVSYRTRYTLDENYDFDSDNPDFNDLKLPVLFKKYLQINGKILEFNVDPLFNNTLDGFMLLEFSKIPESFIDRYEKQRDNEPDVMAENCSCKPED